MNKLFKYALALLCLTINLMCIAADSATTEDTLTCSLYPEKSTYYVGETAVLRIELTLNEENTELNDILGLDGLSLPYIQKPRIQQLNSANPQKYIFAAQISFTEACEGNFSLSILYRTVTRTRHNSFFMMSSINGAKKVTAKPLTFTISNLPESNEPFSGIIGAAMLSTTISTNSASIGDIITLRTTVETTSPFPGDPIPCSIDHIDGFKLYPAKVVDKKQSNASTQYITEQTIVPNRLGEFTIPAPELYYFDTIDGTYKTISEKEPISITIIERKVKDVQDVVIIPIKGDSSQVGTASNATPLIVSSADKEKQLKTNATVVAKLAPSTAALTIFEIPANSSVKPLEQHGGWCRICFNNAYGWIPISALTTGGE